jgi:tetratricopeptide (TPR) repeat protein
VLGRSRIIDALGDLREARGEYERVVDEAAAAGRLDIRGAAMLALANLDQRQGHAAEARRRLDEAAEIASTIRDRALQVRAIFESANLRSWFEGEVEAAAEDLRRALALTEEIQDRALRVEAYMRLGTLLFNVGALVEAEQALLDAAAIAAEDGSFRDETRVMSILAYVKYFRDVEQAERLATQAVDRFERTCDSYLQAQNLRLLAKCALARGDPELAEKRLRDALPLALEGGGWVVVEIYRYLVEALVEQGRLDDARELLVFAARNLPEEDPYARAAALLAEAMVTAAEGERVAASAAFAEVLALLEKQKLLFDLGEARMIFARALRKLGENAGAQTELERARQLFMRMGAPATVAEIDRMLAELRAGAGASGPRDY